MVKHQTSPLSKRPSLRDLAFPRTKHLRTPAESIWKSPDLVEMFGAEMALTENREPLYPVKLPIVIMFPI